VRSILNPWLTKPLYPQAELWGGKRGERVDVELAGLNERMRFLAYAPGQSFAPHCDACYQRPDLSATSVVTLQLYLHDVSAESGGATSFLLADGEEPGARERSGFTGFT
jgi:hypothetical protein